MYFLTFFLLFQSCLGFFLFNPSRRWLFGGSFKNITLENVVDEDPSLRISGLAYYSKGSWGSYGNGTVDGDVHVIRVDSQYSLYIGGDFTKVYKETGEIIETGPVAIMPYNPFSNSDWGSVWGDVPIRFTENDFTGGGPIVYDISTDCWNTPDVSGLSCDTYVGGEFRIDDEQYMGEHLTSPDITLYAYNLFKWDSNSQKIDLLTSLSDDSNEYYHGVVRAVHKKDHENWIFSTTKSDKKVWVGGDFPYGFGVVLLYDFYGISNRWMVASPSEDFGMVNDILYVSKSTDEIWIGGNFSYQSDDGQKTIRNFANFNHKTFMNDCDYEQICAINSFFTFGASSSTIESKWPVSPSGGKGITSISKDGSNKYVSGWDIYLPNEGIVANDSRIFKMDSDGKTFYRLGTTFEHLNTAYIKQIHTCESGDLGCSGGSLIMIGADGYVKYFNTDGDDHLENFGSSEFPFGQTDCVNFVLSKYMLAGNVNKIEGMVIFITFFLLFFAL